MSENLVGVIGWPVTHSLSPVMHNAAFAALGMTDWRYEAMPIPPDIVRHSLRELRDNGIVGVNVTVPLKEAVLPFVKADERALAVGAVNTIDFRDNTATNTDVAGLMQDLAAHEVDVAGRTVVVLGAGGAARAAVYGLASAGAGIALINRTEAKARLLLATLALTLPHLRASVISFEAASALDAVLIVNCTSVGLWPKVDETPWPLDVPLPGGAVVYDMVYRPAQTALMRQADAAGLRTIGGLGMLVRQGAEAFRRWTGVEPPLEVMFAAARHALQERDHADQTRGD